MPNLLAKSVPLIVDSSLIDLLIDSVATLAIACCGFA